MRPPENGKKSEHLWFSLFMKFGKILVLLGLAGTFAAVSFFYLPPENAQRKMITALQNEKVWWLQAVDYAGQSNLKLDFVRNREKGNLARISFPSIKIINNQWIDFGKGEDILTAVQFKKRLTTFRELFREHKEQYEFAVAPGFPQEFSAFITSTGVIWLDAETFLPTQLQLGKLQAQLSYNDPLTNEAGLPRSWEEVLEQLQELLQARNGKPKELMPLTQGGDSTAAFAADFDHDGLSDALEIFYNTDPANPDSDDDTFLDGEEVRRGYNPLGAGH